MFDFLPKHMETAEYFPYWAATYGWLIMEKALALKSHMCSTFSHIYNMPSHPGVSY